MCESSSNRAAALLSLPLLLALCARAQESATLPPPCALGGGGGSRAPGDAPPDFSFAVSGGGANVSSPASAPSALPLALFVVDAARDPGGVLLATDAVEIDRLIAADAPVAGTIAFLAQDEEGYVARVVEPAFASRLALLPPARAAAWRARLAFGVPTVSALGAAGSALAPLLAAWQSPRLWVTAPAPGAVAAPRVDAFYECYQWPPAQRAFPFAGPVAACGAGGAPSVPAGALLLAVNVTADGGACDAAAATAWARAAAPAAAGAILAAPAPAIVGRNCDDTFVDPSFFPMVVASDDGELLASRAAQGAFNVSLNYTCESATWLAVDANGRLAPFGWRKYTEATALRWAVDELLHVADAQRNATAATSVISLMPAGSVVNSFARNVTFDSVRALRRVAGSSALLDFRLQCAGKGDNACGPWDRIFSAFARCWPSAAPPSPLTAAPVEIARWISPFRRSTGRWQSSADVLIALAGNGSSPDDADAAWTCEISSSSCCEPWLGTLDLLVFGGAGGGAAPFAAVPLSLFPSIDSHFGPGFNSPNRSALLQAPSAGFSRATLFALITGHGSDPPPPASQGCEYAPTSHAFAISAGGASPAMSFNSSDIAFDQYMLAGSIFGCADKVATHGVIGNQVRRARRAAAPLRARANAQRPHPPPPPLHCLRSTEIGGMGAMAGARAAACVHSCGT